jgi:hypothetical protein
MPKFQVVNIKMLEGKAKAPPHRDYKMLIVGGMFTGDDGVVEIGEITFMDRADQPLPTHLVPGQSYLPTVGASSRDGKLTFQISELKPIPAAKVGA